MKNWFTQNGLDLVKLGALALIIITTIQGTVNHNSEQLSHLQIGQMKLTEKVENVQLSVVKNTQQLEDMEKTFERHLSQRHD